MSFVDVLDDRTGRGYQRRFNSGHSLDFRRYIREPGSTTIPLTFNLRPTGDDAWRVVEISSELARIEIDDGAARVMAQVDCQHRLGHLADLATELPFMCFVGLSVDEEMAVFNVINSKAKGLNRSLLDFNDARLCDDLARERPELFVALVLANDPASPWHGLLDVGGARVSGMTRLASLRTMQKACRRFLARSRILREVSVEEAARVVLDFWAAVAVVLREVWARPRGNLLAKGVGVYAMMELAVDMWRDSGGKATREGFVGALSDFAPDFDWGSDGPLRGLGGESGVASAVKLLREARSRAAMRVAA